VTEDELDPLKPESWHGVPNVCGSCIAWRADAARDADELATGVCKLRPEIGRVPADLRKCSEYRPRGQFVYQPGKTASPKRRMAKTVSVLRQGADGTMVRSTARAEAVPASFKPVVGGYRGGPEDEAEVQSAPRTIRPAAPSTIDLGALTSTEVARYAIIELVRTEHGRSRRELHPRFKGGRVQASSDKGAARAIPTERFFAMLDRVRSSLDALDGAIAARSGQLGAEATDLRAQVGRMHGSMTTFNVLYADRADYFSSKE